MCDNIYLFHRKLTLNYTHTSVQRARTIQLSSFQSDSIESQQIIYEIRMVINIIKKKQQQNRQNNVCKRAEQPIWINIHSIIEIGGVAGSNNKFTSKLFIIFVSCLLYTLFFLSVDVDFNFVRSFFLYS